MLHFAVVYIYQEWSLSVLYSSICIMSRCDKRQMQHDTVYVKHMERDTILCTVITLFMKQIYILSQIAVKQIEHSRCNVKQR